MIITNCTIKGLHVLNETSTIELIKSMESGDMLAYGIVTELGRCINAGLILDPDGMSELDYLSRLISCMLAAECNYGIVTHGKFYLANTEEDLLPELENIEFSNGQTIYVVLTTAE